MRFPDTNQICFDPQTLGFPSVGSCQAIVCQTDIGLFGFHASSSNLPSHTNKARAFAQYVQSRSLVHAPPTGATHGICVIGVITRLARFGDKQGTSDNCGDELDAIAASLAFTGPVQSMFGLPEHALLCLTERIHALLDRFAIPVKRDPLSCAQVMSHVYKNRSIYARFDWQAKARRDVRFKRWSKMEYYQDGVAVTDPERRDLAVDPSFVATPLNPTSTDGNVQPGTQEQNVHRLGRSDAGSLHKITGCKRFQ